MQTTKIEKTMSVCEMMNNYISIHGFKEGKRRFIESRLSIIETAKEITISEFNKRLDTDAEE